MRGNLTWLGLFAAGLLGCPGAPPPPTARATTGTTSAAVATAPSASASASAQNEGDAASGGAAPEPARISSQRALELLFPKGASKEARACLAQDGEAVRIRCMLRLRFDSDARARDLAMKLYNETGSVAGLDPAHTMDGGWRGMIRLVPEPPTGTHRRHLEWIVRANDDFRSFFDALGKRGGRKLSYRWQPIELRFFRSVGRTTPSAYASGWAIAYNVKGSLHKSADAVRETMFHETFHLNDKEHGLWSSKELEPLYQTIVSRCTDKRRKLSTPCLRPYAPNHTMVRGGTFYAFQPGNGVWEYTAELAIRYYREHRTLLKDQPLKKRAFKCGPEENAKSWRLLVDEFFGGIDLVPTCG